MCYLVFLLAEPIIAPVPFHSSVSPIRGRSWLGLRPHFLHFSQTFLYLILAMDLCNRIRCHDRLDANTISSLLRDGSVIVCSALMVAFR